MLLILPSSKKSKIVSASKLIYQTLKEKLFKIFLISPKHMTIVLWKWVKRVQTKYCQLLRKLAKNVCEIEIKIQLLLIGQDQMKSATSLTPYNAKSCQKNVIPSYVIKVADHLLAPYLTYFFTLSFDFGIFPDMLKNAAVIPIHKTDSTTIILNYLPILVSPGLSKTLEKLMKTRLTIFLEKHSILYPKQ